jgi:hypothetical protein
MKVGQVLYIRALRHSRRAFLTSTASGVCTPGISVNVSTSRHEVLRNVATIKLWVSLALCPKPMCLLIRSSALPSQQKKLYTLLRTFLHSVEKQLKVLLTILITEPTFFNHLLTTSSHPQGPITHPRQVLCCPFTTLKATSLRLQTNEQTSERANSAGLDKPQIHISPQLVRHSRRLVSTSQCH